MGSTTRSTHDVCWCHPSRVAVARRVGGASRRRADRFRCRPLCEHTFVVTSQGSAYARFRRALLTKNTTLIDAAASELPHVSLRDALKILVVLAERRDPRYPRAAARFAARVTLEQRLAPGEAHRVLALAETLPTAPEAVATLLRTYCATDRPSRPRQGPDR